MAAEERNKEIEWLMESIKRSNARRNGTISWIILFSIISFAIGAFLLFYYGSEGSQAVPVFFAIGLLLLLYALTNYVFTKKIARAETPRQLLAAHDRMWIALAVFFVVIMSGVAFLNGGDLISSTCLVLAIVLIVFAAWQAMHMKLRLWVAIFMLPVVGVLLYFSRIGLLEGLPLLLLMIAVFRGDNSAFGSGYGEDKEEDQSIQQEIKRLRELVKESQGNA